MSWRSCRDFLCGPLAASNRPIHITLPFYARVLARKKDVPDGLAFVPCDGGELPGEIARVASERKRVRSRLFSSDLLMLEQPLSGDWFLRAHQRRRDNKESRRSQQHS